VRDSRQKSAPGIHRKHRIFGRRSLHPTLQMTLGEQVVWLFVLSIPIASVAWTITHEEILRELREFCVDRSQQSSSLLRRKFFYLFTCEYCFSHWVTVFLLAVTRYKLLFPDWRGYLLSFLALPFVANFYLGLFAQTKLGAAKDRYGVKVIQHEAEMKAIEKDQKIQQSNWREPAA
jgi:hypothetical protein